MTAPSKTPPLKLVSDSTPAPTALLDRARAVIGTEISGLEQLSAQLTADFARAIDTLQRTSGRVIVTGMGKSGHIARKIAATMASVGTPAMFVHPAEASHGDLGMITQNDAVLAISNSGEAPELGDIIAYCKRFSIPLIAITKNASSTLGQMADICLTLPNAAEACPMGLAPTTSTTMTLALGDAMAVCLLESNGFSADQFREFHPGGKLGQKLLKVGKIMHSGAELPIAKPDDLMRDILIVMTAKRFGCVGIVGKDGLLQGVITDGDLRRKMSDDFLNLTAAEVMTVNPTAVTPSMLAAEALAIMNQKSITSLFVVDTGRLCGILHIHDLLRAGVV